MYLQVLLVSVSADRHTMEGDDDDDDDDARCQLPVYVQMPRIGQKPSDEFVFGNCFVWDWFLDVVTVDAIFTCTFLTLLEEA